VNRPFAPTSICGSSRSRARTAAALAGEGEPVEWAVEMRRFDENATLDHLAIAERSTRTGRRARARRRDSACAAPSVEADLDRGARDVSSRRTSGIPRDTGPVRCARVRQLTREPTPASTACARCCARAAGRARRRGHGDLHLGNIALIEARPVPFDAIEFDPLIAAGDVLYDLAFC
jgi:aminoglycoside phosphotransferase family enzyme